MFSMSLIKPICIGRYLIWRFLGPSQISQLKSPNINRFTVILPGQSLLYTRYCMLDAPVCSRIGWIGVHDTTYTVSSQLWGPLLPRHHTLSKFFSCPQLWRKRSINKHTFIYPSNVQTNCMSLHMVSISKVSLFIAHFDTIYWALERTLYLLWKMPIVINTISLISAI